MCVGVWVCGCVGVWVWVWVCTVKGFVFLPMLFPSLRLFVCVGCAILSPLAQLAVESYDPVSLWVQVM